MAEKIIPAGAELLQLYDTLFGISKNVARQIPNIRDGLKPVQRKILYTMNEIGKPDDSKKVGSIIGEVLKIYSHGDASVTDALIRMATTWGNIAPYLVGVGNFGCFREDTEILCERGWVYFDQLTDSDKLASVDPISGKMIFEKPTKIVRYEYKGDMIEGKHEQLDFSVTPNHRMLIKEYHQRVGFSNTFTFKEADMLPKYSRLMTQCYYDGEKDGVIVLPEYKSTVRVYPETHISMDIWVQFLGIYLADGFVNADNNRIYVSGVKYRKRVYFKEILSQMGVKFGFSGDSYSFVDKRIVDKLNGYGLLGKHALDKFVPDFIFKLDYTLIRKFLFAFAMGDGMFGHWNDMFYFTSSEKMAEQIQILLLMSGEMSKIYLRPPRLSIGTEKTIQSNNICYTVHSNGNPTISIDKRCQVKYVPYDGYVYCAEVPTYHTLITRKNKCILISGNSPMGDAPAAARYIEAKLSPFARQCFFTDKLCIDMVPTYDNTKMEPETLPAMFPTVIINGATGSGFGASTNIPQYNLRDVIETTIKLIDNPNAPIKLIPDSQWGCDIMSAKPFGKYKNTFDQIFETGYGSYIQRFRYQIDHQTNKVVVTALPAKVPLEGILKEIERLQNENKAFPEVKSMIDLSGKDHGGGIWVEFQLYEGKNPYRLISKLESVTDMKKTVKVNVDLVDGLEVKHYSIRSYILTWYQYRHDYIRSCISTELTNVDSDIAINDIKLFIFGEDRLEKTTDIYVNSVDTDDIIKKLMREYSKSTGMTSQQASILAGMSGKDYTKSALKKYKELKITLQQRHDELTRTIQDPNGINDIIKDQLKSGLKFAKPRAAKIIGASEAVIDDRVVVAIQPSTKQIAKLPIGDDSSLLLDSLPANLCIEIDTSYNAIIFDNKGKYIVINPGEIPMMNNLSSMVPVNRYIDKPLSTPIAIAAMDDDCKNFLVITKLGKIKKINPRNYKNRIKENVYITIEDNDEVVSIIGLKSDSSDIFVYTDRGYAQRFPSSIVSVTSQSAMGQYGLAAPEGEVITGAFSVKPSDLIACITKQGYIRINNMKAFPNRKTKNKWEHFIHTVNNDRLLFVISCTASDVLHIVYSNLTTADIPVKNIGVETFGMPPKPIAKADKLTVINVKKTKAKKQN